MKNLLFLIFAFTLIGQTVAFTQDANEILKNKQIENYKHIISLNRDSSEVEKAKKLLEELESENIDNKVLIKSEITGKEEQELMKKTLPSEEYDVWKTEKHAAKNNSPKLK
jgi:phage terminase large subunit-like protein